MSPSILSLGMSMQAAVVERHRIESRAARGSRRRPRPRAPRRSQTSRAPLHPLSILAPRHRTASNDVCPSAPCRGPRVTRTSIPSWQTPASATSDPRARFPTRPSSTLENVEPVAYATLEDLLGAVAERHDRPRPRARRERARGNGLGDHRRTGLRPRLVILQEIVLPIHLHLLARPGVALEDDRRACAATFTRWPRSEASSTSGASSRADDVHLTGRARRRRVERDRGPRSASRSRESSSDSRSSLPTSRTIPDNATRFVLVGRDDVAAPTGHDRTTIVCFQDADRPGSLYAILGRFAARDINLTKLESRPTKRGLGDYCFVIEFEGHVADDVVADCLADLQAHLARVKFLGSYPVTGEGATDRRDEVVAARRSRPTVDRRDSLTSASATEGAEPSREAGRVGEWATSCLG